MPLHETTLDGKRRAARPADDNADTSSKANSFQARLAGTRTRRTRAASRWALALTGLFLFHPARAGITFDVSVEDMAGAEIAGLPPFSDFHDRIVRHVLAAGALWAGYLVGDAAVSVRVQLYPQANLPADNPELLADTPNTFRERTGFVRNENGLDTVEFAPAYKIRTGRAVDDSGLPDVTIRIGERYLKTMLFFDADPTNRTAAVPPGATEAFGRFVHELGHALGFNGFFRGDGIYDPIAKRSTFDRYITWDGAEATFNGPLATAFYGGPVPLTANARGHLGSDADPRLFSLAAAEAMNGETVYEGMRYNVSELDVRILCDIGVPCVLQAASASPDRTPAAAQEQQQAAIEYYHAGLDHYFVTALPDEIAKLDSGSIAGWQRTGRSFPVFPANAAGRASVCRFFSASFAPRSSHFYSALPSECDLLKSNPDWQYEGEAFAVALPDAAGNCAYPLVPLYRFYNNGQGGAPNHRYATASDVREEMLARGWVAEGAGPMDVAACVPH